jgi:alcohol dehydrogenase YqhD (iron-dependent ADH family)
VCRGDDMIVKDLLGKKIVVLCRNKEITKFLNICYDEKIVFADGTKATSKSEIRNKEKVYLHLQQKSIQWGNVTDKKTEDLIQRGFTIIDFSELLDHIPEEFRYSFEYVRNQYYKK